MSHGGAWVPWDKLYNVVHMYACNCYIIGIFIYPGIITSLSIRSKNIIQNGITHKFKQLHVNRTVGDKKKKIIEYLILIQ